MPYVTRVVRFELENRYPETCGELNYKITKELVRFIETRGLSYQTINDILGALEGAKAEFYRRVVVPYESQKAHDNGDVY